MASRSIDGSNDRLGGSCTRTFYTTDRICTTARREPPALTIAFDAIPVGVVICAARAASL
jgi:hypothetical protein